MRPIIQRFDISKTAIHDGEPITVSWEVMGADEVEISGIGWVDAQGTKTIRLPQLQRRPGLTLVLRARHSISQQTAEKGIYIKNKSYTERAEMPVEAEKPATKQPIKPREVPVESDPVDVDTLPLPQPIVPKEPVAAKFSITAATATPTPEKQPKNDIYVYLIFGIMMVLIAILAVLVYRMNGLS